MRLTEHISLIAPTHIVLKYFYIIEMGFCAGLWAAYPVVLCFEIAAFSRNSDGTHSLFAGIEMVQLL